MSDDKNPTSGDPVDKGSHKPSDRIVKHGRREFGEQHEVKGFQLIDKTTPPADTTPPPPPTRPATDGD